VGARLGKSGGALINQGLIAFFGAIALITPYVAGILFFIIFAWIYSAKSLGKLYNKLAQDKEQAKAAAPAEPAMAKATVQQ
jgi:AAA family ATP:ADP antiporter